MDKEKLKLYMESTKAVWKGFYESLDGDAPERAYKATKKTVEIVYAIHLKSKMDKLKEFFNEKKG